MKIDDSVDAKLEVLKHPVLSPEPESHSKVEKNPGIRSRASHWWARLTDRSFQSDSSFSPQSTSTPVAADVSDPIFQDATVEVTGKDGAPRPSAPPLPGAVGRTFLRAPKLIVPAKSLLLAPPAYSPPRGPTPITPLPSNPADDDQLDPNIVAAIRGGGESSVSYLI